MLAPHHLQQQDNVIVKLLAKQYQSLKGDLSHSLHEAIHVKVVQRRKSAGTSMPISDGFGECYDRWRGLINHFIEINEVTRASFSALASLVV